MFAVTEGHRVIVQRLVSAGADVHIKNKVCGVMECVKYYCDCYREPCDHATIYSFMCIPYSRKLWQALNLANHSLIVKHIGEF